MVRRLQAPTNAEGLRRFTALICGAPYLYYSRKQQKYVENLNISGG